MVRGSLIVVASLLCTRAALAQVAVTPVQVTLDSQATSSLVALTNNGPSAMRFEVTAKSWAQAQSGEMQLEDTKDIAFYPAIFELAPGATRRVRVGALTPMTRGERTYRLFIEQLPHFDGQVMGVQVLTRLSLPIFLGDKPVAASPQIAEARIERGALKIRVGNVGEQHFTIRGVRVSGRSVDGGATFEKKESGWYVLGGGERAYAIAIDHCAQLAGLDLEVETDVTSLHAKLPVTATDCDP